MQPRASFQILETEISDQQVRWVMRLKELSQRLRAPGGSAQHSLVQRDCSRSGQLSRRRSKSLGQALSIELPDRKARHSEKAEKREEGTHAPVEKLENVWVPQSLHPLERVLGDGDEIRVLAAIEHEQGDGGIVRFFLALMEGKD